MHAAVGLISVHWVRDFRPSPSPCSWRSSLSGPVAVLAQGRRAPTAHLQTIPVQASCKELPVYLSASPQYLKQGYRERAVSSAAARHAPQYQANSSQAVLRYTSGARKLNAA